MNIIEIDIFKELQANIPKEQDGDYIKYSEKEKCEVLYCGKCNTRKQFRIIKPKTVHHEAIDELLPRLCDCEAQKRFAQKREIELQQKRYEIEDRKIRCFPSSGMIRNTFDNDDGSSPEVSTKLKNYASNFIEARKKGAGLILHGPVGTGKSYYAAAICNKITDDGYFALFTSFKSIEDELWGASGNEKSYYIDRLVKSNDLIVFDDLGVDRNTEFMQGLVYDVVNARYETGLPMLFTTNLDIDSILNPHKHENANVRVYDRIIERCLPLEVAGRSRRRETYKKNKEDFEWLLKGGS